MCMCVCVCVLYQEGCVCVNTSYSSKLTIDGSVSIEGDNVIWYVVLLGEPLVAGMRGASRT